jgi:peptidoglycan/xylan/chitin deacetylase (PgdA/CDA1 family)
VGPPPPGRPLAPGPRAALERGFGHDFARVRIHTDPESAREVERNRAAAMSTGTGIAFARDRYRPDTQPGLGLLAHELAHVVQHERVGMAPHHRSRTHDPAVVQARAAVAALGWGGLRAAYPAVAADVRPAPGHRPDPRRPALSAPAAPVSLVELTYDDGPDSAGNTRRVLDTLNAAGARATFYVVGKRVAQGENWRLVFDIAAAGHWLGNHAYDWNDATDNHIFLTGTAKERAEKILMTEWAIRDALIKGRAEAKQKQTWDTIPAANRSYIEDVIARGTGRFRTPGFRSHLWTVDGTTTRAAIASVNQVLAASGLRTLAITEVGTLTREGVTVDPEDWRKGRTASQISGAVKADATDNSDSILLHSRIAATAQATPDILATLQQRKFSFDPTARGSVGRLSPRPGFAGLSTISDPPTSAQIATARKFLRTRRAGIGPYLSGSVAIGILQLAQRAGPKEVDDFLAEIRSTTVQTPPPTGAVPLANWMAVNPEWSLLLGFYENWRLNRPFPRIKGVTL